MAGTEKDETLAGRALARLKEHEALEAEEERLRTAERRLQRQQALRDEIKRVLDSDTPVEGDRVRIDGLLFAWGRPDDSYSSGLYLLRHCSRCGREVCPYPLEGYDADEGLLALGKALGAPAALCMGCYYELEDAREAEVKVAGKEAAAGQLPRPMNWRGLCLQLRQPVAAVGNTIGRLTGLPVPHLSRGGHLYKRASAGLYRLGRHVPTEPQARTLSRPALSKESALNNNRVSPTSSSTSEGLVPPLPLKWRGFPRDAQARLFGDGKPEREMTHRELERWVGELAERIEDLESRIDQGLAAVEEVQERSARQQRESRQAMQNKISNLEFDAWEAQRQASKAARGW